MPTVVPVRFRYAVRDLWFDPADADPIEGDHVICSPARGTEIGLVTHDPVEEDEAALEELCAFLRQTHIERAGVFPFSPEEGTRAALMDHVDTEEARRRAELVVDVQSDIIDDYNESVLGTEREVLCEGFDGQAQMFFGRSYAESPDIDGRIYFTAEEEVAPGTFVNVRLTGTMDGELTGEMA